MWRSISVKRTIKFRDCTSDLEFFRGGDKSGSRNEGCEKVHQTDSNPGPDDQQPNTLTTRLPTTAAESTENLCYFYALTLLMYTVASPDPNPRGGGQLPNSESAILR